MLFDLEHFANMTGSERYSFTVHEIVPGRKNCHEALFASLKKRDREREVKCPERSTKITKNMISP